MIIYISLHKYSPRIVLRNVVKYTAGKRRILNTKMFIYKINEKRKRRCRHLNQHSGSGCSARWEFCRAFKHSAWLWDQDQVWSSTQRDQVGEGGAWRGHTHNTRARITFLLLRGWTTSDLNDLMTFPLTTMNKSRVWSSSRLRPRTIYTPLARFLLKHLLLVF